MRCKCCDRVMTGVENLSRNRLSGGFEDMCVVCRAESSDGGVEYEMDSWGYRNDLARPVKFYNIVDHDIQYTGGYWTALNSPKHYLKIIMTEGVIKIEDNS